METYIVFAVVAVIILLMGYFMYLVQQDRKASRHVEDAVASVSQLASGSLAGAAVPQEEPVFDYENVDYDEAQEDDYNIPLGLLVDYMLGLLAPETQELVKRKFAEQNCYLNPLKKDAEGRVDLNLFIETPQGREPIFTMEGFKPGEASPLGRELNERVKAIRERRPYKRSGNQSLQGAIGSLFESELESLDAKVRSEEEAARRKAEQAGGGVQEPVVQPAPAQEPKGESEPSKESAAQSPVASAKPESGVESAAAEVLGQGRRAGFVGPPKPEPAEAPAAGDVAGVEGAVDSQEVSHQPTEASGDAGDGPSEEDYVDTSSVFEDEGRDGGEDIFGAEAPHVEEPSGEEPELDVFAGIPDDVVDILKNPNQFAVPYCIYVSRRFRLGIEYDLSSVRPELAIPSIDEVKVMCRDWELEAFFPLLRNMQRTGDYVDEALAGGGGASFSRPKGGKIVIKRDGK